MTDKGNGKFSFVMPEGKVTVTPTFVADNGGQTESKSFSDVKTGDWYADAVKYVTDKGLMNGTDDNQFSPSATTTRGNADDGSRALRRRGHHRRRDLVREEYGVGKG